MKENSPDSKKLYFNGRVIRGVFVFIFSKFSTLILCYFRDQEELRVSSEMCNL